MNLLIYQRLERKYVILCIIIILSSWIIFLADRKNFFAPLSLRTYDALFYIKSQVSEADPVSPIVMVEIDDRTFEDNAFKIPMILWHNYFAKVIKGLADSGARVIALDYLLPGELFDDIAPNYSQAWLKAFGYAKAKGVPVITGYIEMTDRQGLPHARYLQIIGLENVGLFNLTADSDDFIRRQRLIFPSGKGRKRLFSFSYLVARAFQPDIFLPSETVYIDYLPPDVFFPRYSFADIYRKISDQEISFLRKQFQGKIILIGSTDSLNQDRHPTPLYYLHGLKNKRSHGVEIVGNVINTLFRGRFFSEIPLYFRFCIYLGLAILAGLFIFGEHQRRYICISSPVLLFLYGSISVICFLDYYIILPLIPGIAVIILCQGVSLFYRYAVVDREKRQMRCVFQRFLPAKVVTQLLTTKEADLLRGESRRLCILFSDIRGFTKYSETKSPEDVVSRLNEYFEAMSAAVSSEDGIVDKFMGDGLMAFFGAFDTLSNPSSAGVRSALRMLEKLEFLNQKWKLQGQETFRIGIGIHIGEVKVGNIGSQNKMEYTIIGDAVNLTSRIQDKTKALKEMILISEEVYREVTDEVIAEDKGIEDIRGRSPIRVYAVRGWKNGEL